VCFPSFKAAEERIAEIGVEGWAVYTCPFCGCWHASSRGTGGHRRPEKTAST
jgi:hypothetical protein